MIVAGFTILCQLAAAAYTLRLFWCYGKQWAWTVVCVLVLARVFIACLVLPQTHPAGRTSPLQSQADINALLM